MKNAPSIVWFFHDLRLRDNIALSRAAANGAIVPVYIFDDSLPTGGASNWWQHQALKNLSHDLAQHKISLLLKRGDALKILRALIAETGAKTVTWARRYEPALAARDALIADALRRDGIEVTICEGFLLFEPEQIQTKSGTPFKVFTPFSKTCLAAPAPAAPLPAPKNMRGIDGLRGEDLADCNLTPPRAVWPKTLAQEWTPGEQAAHDRLHAFLDEALPSYKTDRDRPDVEGTSRLSPYLHFGHISPRQVWHAVNHAIHTHPTASSSAERFLLEVLWREFSWHLLHHIPDFTTHPLQKSFAKFPWRKNAKELQAWQRGQTGYPLIDAGMRQLWQTGWMHNRVRMIAASFLIKDLLIDWRTGMEWFWDTLVDADLGSNTASWQWVAGCGADAAPYFRIFNPILQGRKFDPNGDYIRRFVPELAGLDAKFIHEPWKTPPEIIAKAGITLGKTYPNPLIDHSYARTRALEALQETKTTL